MTISCVDFCRALADDTRQRILEMLQGGEEMCVGDIVEVFNVSQPTISHHLSILRGLGLLNSRKEGKQVFYSLNEENVTECCGMLMIKFVPDPDKVVELLSETG